MLIRTSVSIPAIMAVTLTKIPCYSPTPALPTLLRKNTPPNDYSSKRADSVSSLHSNLLPSSFPQPVIYHSLPPHPPIVVLSSTMNRIHSHSLYTNDFDRVFNDLISMTGRIKDKDGVSLIYVLAKGSPSCCLYFSFILSLYKIENTDRTNSYISLLNQHIL